MGVNLSPVRVSNPLVPAARRCVNGCCSHAKPFWRRGGCSHCHRRNGKRDVFRARGNGRAVSESREISRLARSAYVVTVERELLRRANAARLNGDSPDAVTARRTESRFRQAVDTLEALAADNPERTARLVAIRDAHATWNGLLSNPFSSSSAARGHSSASDSRYCVQDWACS